MTIKIAVNGYGRIGRCIVRALIERDDDIDIVAINDLAPNQQKAHLTRFDSTHGIIGCDVDLQDDEMQIGRHKVKLLSQADVSQLPWKQLNVDVVLECTGKLKDRASAEKHLAAGAKKVLLSAPGKEVDISLVYGVNHHQLQANHTIVSNSSCTTNCLAPLVKPLDEAVGLVSGVVNTVHAYTNDQNVLDSSHSDLHRARAAAMSIIPTSTGAAAALGVVLPQLKGRLNGFALRVPTPNVSIVDLTFKASRSTSVDEINSILTRAVQQDKHGVTAVNQLPLVSIDFNHNPASSIFDLTQTIVIDDLVKVLAWYDNEWGFANRMLDVTLLMVH